MFCKNCGNQLTGDAKFCPSCGQPVEQKNEYTAPRPFERNSVDESQNYQYQKSAFKGKQMSTGTSGSISFGNNRKKGGFGKLIKFVIIAAIVVIGISYVITLFGGSPITYIESGTGFDSANSELSGKTETFATTTPEIYILFDYEDLEVGDRLYLNLFFGDEELSLDSYYFDIEEDIGWGYVAFTPTTTWTVGDYQVEFVVDDELLESYEFSVE